MRRRRTWIAIAFAAVLLGGAAVWLIFRPQTYWPPNDRIVVPNEMTSIARGKHVVEAIAVCTVCHGDDLGGKLAFDDPVLGHGYTANLTGGRGGIGARYGVKDWIRSIRYGIRPDGTAIKFMPSDHYNAISDSDLGAMIAYLTSLPPVDNERTSVELNLWAKLLISLGVFGKVNRADRIDASRPRRNWRTDEGAYLVEVGGCAFCHGPRLKGGQGPEPGAPAAPDLTGDGTRPLDAETDFVRSLREGVASDGHAIQARYMPWLGYRGMTDAELRAIWRFVHREM